MKKETEKKILQAANLAPSEEMLEKIVEVHPMKQIFVMSIVQVVVLALMGLSMLGIGALFK
tara:strand:+ start:876 stop:1058 length:183 start_codon:yes stop_codon:yes gene_type:complete